MSFDDLNHVVIAGNLVRDPEVKALENGTLLLSGTVASNKSWKNKSGEYQKDTTFVNFTVFGNYAKMLQKFLSKGAKVIVNGRLQIKAVDAEGGKKYYTSVVADAVQILKKGSGSDDLSDPVCPGDGAEDSTPF